MLESVIAEYLDRLREREFDAPFMALLHKMGFYDVHLVHGTFEFGKDFIAKRQEEGGAWQYLFQTKAGDVGAWDWAKLRPQLDELRQTSLGHPNIDHGLPRRAVLVMTGRLKGKAALLAQDYGEACRRQGETELAVWERDNIISEILRDNGVDALVPGGPALMKLLGAIDDDSANLRDIELYSRAWTERAQSSSHNLWPVLLETALLSHRLLLKRRGHLSVATILAGWRTVLSLSLQGASAPLADAESLADRMFEFYSEKALEGFDPGSCEDEALYYDHGRWDRCPISHSVRCSIVVELLALRALRAHLRMESESASRSSQLLEQFLRKHRAAAHPISDRYAPTALLAASALLVSDRRAAALDFLKRIVVWLCDCYERAGLAGVHSTEKQEIEQLVGYALEHLDVEKRDASYLATVVLDVLAAAGESELYENARNDFLAVGVRCTQNHPHPKDHNFYGNGQGTFVESNIQFLERLPCPPLWEAAAHHRTVSEVQPPVWGPLAISALVRDRHWVRAVRELIGAGRPSE